MQKCVLSRKRVENFFLKQIYKLFTVHVFSISKIEQVEPKECTARKIIYIKIILHRPTLVTSYYIVLFPFNLSKIINRQHLPLRKCGIANRPFLTTHSFNFGSLFLQVFM